jgi:FSR family fosmidomycin resistance protein-like MFS transporter
MLNILQSTKNKTAFFLTAYGLSHAVVDASCAFLILGAIAVKTNIWLVIVLYNALAFGLQVPFGMMLDKYNYPRFVVITGLLFVFIAYFGLNEPMGIAILAGIGNALFHVGGGKVSLQIDYKKAIYPGLFVAPGGIGLAIGIYLAKINCLAFVFVFPISLFVMSIILFFVKIPELSVAMKPSKQSNYVGLIILLLLLSIAVRSVVGLTIQFPWKTHIPLLILLTSAIALGKILGGLFADKYGWMKIGLGGLVCSIPLLFFGTSIAAMGIIGIFIFNFTMPITLVAISNELPNRAGFSFGLTTLALFIGGIPSFTKHKVWFSQQWILVTLIIIASITFYIALKTMKKTETLVK